MNRQQEESLLQLFIDFVTEIERHKTLNWKIHSNEYANGDKGMIVLCNNGTRNFIDEIPTASGVIALWNARNPYAKVKEHNKSCIEDDDRYTTILWELKHI